jgi:hypothetical protein
VSPRNGYSGNWHEGIHVRLLDVRMAKECEVVLVELFNILQIWLQVV